MCLFHLENGWSPASSNVTQAAVHKGEMERTNNTHKKRVQKNKKIPKNYFSEKIQIRPLLKTQEKDFHPL